MSDPWMAATVAVVVLFIPCGARCLYGELADRLVALELVAMNATLALVLAAAAFGRPPYFDVALALALLTFASGLVFVRFLERWF